MGFSFWHLVIVLVIVLLLFGPNRLPTLGKSIGEAIRGFKKGLNDEEIDVTATATHKEQIRDSQSADVKQEQKTQNTTEKNRS
jgi:sec-independent protein translocase protein TatA